MKFVFEFEGVKFEVKVEAFVKKAGSIIQLPDGRLVKPAFWFIKESPPSATGILEVEIIKAEVAE